jgi:hypothetical protein
MRRDPEVGLGMLCDERLHVAQKVLGGFEEACLAGIASNLEARAQIGRPQQYDPNPDRSGCGDDLFAEQIGIVVGPSAGVGVQVMELADGGRSGEQHLEKRHARYVVHVFGRELRSRVIHGSAPAPEVSAADDS